MKYTDGTVSIENGSYVITGSDVSWQETIHPGWFLTIESIIGAFQIAKVTATTLEITKPISLETISGASGLSYIACAEFTPFYGLVIPGNNDPDKVMPIQQALNIFDRELLSPSDG